MMDLFDKALLESRNDLQVLSTKTYAHSIGLSVALRQHRAESHCQLLHGYALQVRVVFSSIDNDVDIRGWVVDFGSLKSFKTILENNFDHCTLISEDDPALHMFKELEDVGVCKLVILPLVCMEGLAAIIFSILEGWLIDAGYGNFAAVDSVEVSEHPSNSAIVRRRK